MNHYFRVLYALLNYKKNNDKTFTIKPTYIDTLSSHPLLIETGRYSGVPCENRKCIYCDMDDIEDELHFVCICTKYTMLRNTYISRYYSRNPSMHKFIELLNSNNLKTLKHLAIFIIKALELRLQTDNNIN